MNRSTSASVLVLSVLVALGACSSGAGALSDVPPTVDPNARYVIYLHGIWIEMHGKNTYNPRSKTTYQYDDIVAALGRKGFVVISEVRGKGTDVAEFAQKVAGQVKTLVARGVEPAHITVIGHSKGGMITLVTASQVGAPGVNYVVMAGCARPERAFRRGYARFLQRGAANLSGRVLSLYDEADDVSATCRESLEQASGLLWKEKVLQTGKGHALFHTPSDAWLDPATKWASGLAP